MCKNSWKRCFCFKAKNIEFNFGGIVSFKKKMNVWDVIVLRKLWKWTKKKPQKEIAKLLNVKKKTEIDHIKRVRNIDGEK